jgi:large subunit ribosomal protein L13
MKTTTNFIADRKWYIIDAEGQTLGRMCTAIAKTLSGKGKVDYTPGVDGGDYVVVLNVGKFKVTGAKMADKMYYKHTQYKGSMQEVNLEDMLEKKPFHPIKHAVNGMLPKNKLRSKQMLRLKLIEGDTHDFTGAQLEELKVK